MPTPPPLPPATGRGSRPSPPKPARAAPRTAADRNEPIQTLSSLHTYATKYALPGVWLAIILVAFPASVVSALRLPEFTIDNAETLLCLAVATPFILWGSTLFKVVRVDSRHLYVTRFWRVVAVPLSDITAVSQSSGGRHPHIVVEFAGPTAVGKSVNFFPVETVWWVTRGLRLGEQQHPVVEELQHRVRMARELAAMELPPAGTTAGS